MRSVYSICRNCGERIRVLRDDSGIWVHCDYTFIRKECFLPIGSELVATPVDDGVGVVKEVRGD